MGRMINTLAYPLERKLTTNTAVDVGIYACGELYQFLKFFSEKLVETGKLW